MLGGRDRPVGRERLAETLLQDAVRVDGRHRLHLLAGVHPASRRCSGAAAALTPGSAGRSIRLQPKSSYQEWQRDRPVEATTTYRRIRQGAKSGQVLLHDKGTSLRSPPSVQDGRPYPGPEARSQPPENDHGDRDHSRPTRSREPAASLGMRCRNCGASQPIGLSYVCPACFGPLEVDYDYAVVAATLTPRGDRGPRARGSGVTRSCCRSTRRPRAACRSARRPSSRADRLAPLSGIDRLWIKDDTRNPSLSFKDRAVAVAAARAVEFGVEALACASTGNLAGATAAAAAAARAAGLRLHPGRPGAGQDRPRPRLRRDGRPDRGHLRRRQPPLPRGRRRDRLGLRQHQPPPVLRRGLQDPRLRDRRVARLALAGRHRRPRRLGRDVHPGRPRLRRARRRRPHRPPAHPLRRRPGRRLRPGRHRMGGRDGRHRAGPDADTIVRSLAIGNPADGRYVVELARRHAAARSRRSRTRSPRPPSGRGPARGDLPGDGRWRDPGRGRRRPRRGRHPRRRRGRRAADRQRPQDAGRADPRPCRRRGPTRRARARPAIRPSLSAFERWLEGGL